VRTMTISPFEDSAYGLFRAALSTLLGRPLLPPENPIAATTGLARRARSGDEAAPGGNG
jgi:hypothetical protein